MNKPVYSGLSILEISETPMYEFWYKYTKSKHVNNVKLCYMDTDSFIMHFKTEDVEKWFDTSNYDLSLNRPLTTNENKKPWVYGE